MCHLEDALKPFYIDNGMNSYIAVTKYDRTD